MAKRILIADDSPTFRLLEEVFLVQRGYKTLHAENGAEALRLSIEEKPDLVILDIQMPVMDGVQVLKALKSNEATRSIPVIIASTIGRDHDRDLLVRGGADDFLSKPINGQELLVRVHRLIGA
jgi:DNA-binding response OmpR family regulator